MSLTNPDRRPGRRWYVLSGVVAALGVVAAFVVLGTGLWSWGAEFPQLGDRFRSGQSVPVDLRAGQPVVLYVSPDTASFDWRCGGEVAGTPISVTEVPYTFTFVSGWQTWAARYEVEAERDGHGSLTCVAAPGSGGALLAVGEQPDNGRVLRKLAITVAASGCTALFGLVAGGVVALVVWRRRRNRR